MRNLANNPSAFNERLELTEHDPRPLVGQAAQKGHLLCVGTTRV